MRTLCSSLAVLTAALAVSTACMSREEVALVKSPSGKLAAVLVEKQGAGATTSFEHDVLIRTFDTSGGKAVASFYGAYSGHGPGVTLRWAGRSDLVLEYTEAREAYLLTPRVSVGGEEVTVTLRPGVGDPELPPEGVLYNLQGRPIVDQPRQRR